MFRQIKNNEVPLQRRRELSYQQYDNCLIRKQLVTEVLLSLQELPAMSGYRPARGIASKYCCKATAVREEIKTMKIKLHAVVSIKEYREEESKYDDSRKLSGLNQ